MTGRAGGLRAGGSPAGDQAALARVEMFCDMVPRRNARAEEHGPLVLFVTRGPGWPYYARPRRERRQPITAAHVRAVRARQRELGVPQSFEWVDELVPEMSRAASAAGLVMTAHPLMILDGPAARPAVPPGVTVRAISPDEPDLARIVAVPDVAFGHPGTAVGTAGPAERDKLAAERDQASIARMSNLLATGQSVLVAAVSDDGPLAAGSCQSLRGVAEITGVGTLPVARRRGLGAAVTAELAELAVRGGAHTVFLSASDDAVARVYAGLGFRRIGTAMIAEPG